MRRFWLALLALLSLWPAPAAVGFRAQAWSEGPALQPLVAGEPSAAVRPLGGWELLSGLDSGASEQDRKREPRSGSLALDGFSRNAATAIPYGTIVPSADDALLDSGVLIRRYAHLSYYATAPPSSR